MGLLLIPWKQLWQRPHQAYDFGEGVLLGDYRQLGLPVKPVIK